MRNPLERRIAGLEALQPPKSDKIPVFVWDEDEVPKKIEEMIAAGELLEADRHRCVYWLRIKHRLEWGRDAEDEKLLAEDAARQKATQEQAGLERAELEREPEKAGEQNAERPNAEQQAPQPQTSEHQTPEHEAAERPEPEQQTPEQQRAEDRTIDPGTVPPGCLTH